MPPRLKWFLAVIVVLTVSPARSTEPKPAWQELPGDWAMRIIVSDPLPHLRRLLRSEALRKTLTEGKLAQFLEASQERLGGSNGRRMSRLAEWVSSMGDVREKLDPQNWLAAIEGQAAFVPEEIVLAAPDEAVAAVGDWFQAVLLFELTPAAVRLDDHAAELQDSVIKLLQRAQLPQLTLRVRFRDPQLPNLAFAQAKALVPQLVPPDWNATIEDHALGVKLRLDALYGDEALKSMIVVLGFAAEGDEKLAAMSKAAGKFELQAWLEHDENDLVITLGERPKGDGRNLTAERLGPLWSDETGNMLFTTWQFAGFKRRIRESAAMLERFADSPAGRAAAEGDDNDFLGTLRRMDDRLRRAAGSGSARLSLHTSLEMRSITQGAPLAPPLNESPILKLIPKNVEEVSLSTIDSLGQSLAAMLDNFEDRLETRSLQYDVTGKGEMAAQLRRVKEYYYGEMQDVRRLVFDEAPKVFQPPLASLFGTSGRIDRLKVSFGAEGGVRQTIELRDVPSPEFAVIAQASDADAAQQFIADLAERLRGHLRGAPVDGDEKPAPRPLDVGLGVPTFGFGTLGSRVTGGDGHEETWRIEAEGDVLPHYYARDQFVIVSTSVRLSKAILVAGRGEADRLTPPRAESGELIGYGTCPADLFARLIEQIGNWSAALADEKKTTIEGELFETIRPTGEGAQALSGFLAGMAEIVRIVEGAEWETSQSSEGRTSRFTISPHE